MTFFDYIRRWRHTRGYGVHSPLAFRIVKECVRPDGRYGFYCDAYLDYEYRDDRRGRSRGRLIIRLLNLLRPSHVWMPDADPRIINAIKMIMPGMRVATRRECPKGADFIICSGRDGARSLWEKMEGLEECGILAFGHPAFEAAGVSLEMESKEFRLLLRRAGMQYIRYDL